MATRNLVSIYRPAVGGLDNTSDPTVLDANFLTAAENITYLEGGQRKRRKGLLAYQASSSFVGSSTNAMVSTASNVRALSDFWFYNTASGLTAQQRLVAVTGASIFRSTGDGLWTALTASSSFGTNGNLKTNIVVAQDHAVISDGVTAPIAYEPMTTTLVAPSTGAVWPVFESAVYHQNRLVMLGLSTSPSHIRLSAADNIFDSTGTDAVTLPIDVGDGDRVVGAAQTWFRNLYVFKGPQYGSVHEISGNTPATYAKNKITNGAPALSHHVIVTTPTDIYWMSKYGIHGLQTTLKYGDVEQGYLSLPIQNFWRKEQLLQSDLDNAKGFWIPQQNVVGWIVTPQGFGGAGGRYWILVYNYAISDPSPGGKKFWSVWTISRDTIANFGLTSATLILSPAGGFQPTHVGDPAIFFGSDRGMVYQGDYNHFEDDGGTYPVVLTTPIITRFNTSQGVVPETAEKQYMGVVTYYSTPDSTITSGMTYSATTDNRPAGTGGFLGVPQGAVLGTFILGTDTLGGTSFLFEESIIEGRGRGLQVSWVNTAVDQDFEHLGFAIRFAAAETEPKEPS